MKLWKGRFQKEADAKTNDFNSSISVDRRMAAQDIAGSIAHATMLGACGIIAPEESEKICRGLEAILAEIETGTLPIDPDAEDIHTFIEGALTARIGEAGKRLHTARSRNDQVALDTRMTVKAECDEILALLKAFTTVLAKQAQVYSDAVMPGYTHMQRAQPVTLGHHLLAYGEMLLRDLHRFQGVKESADVMPLGNGALAGSSYPVDRQMTADLLGFSKISQNSLDGVSDRDFCAEAAFAASMTMVHLSRFCEELILWCSWEFKFIELDDAFATGSSIMPQKKNPDIAELIRGKSGRVFGDLMALLTMMKGLPLAYNKDMQEDKEAVFDALDTIKLCLTPLIPMVETMTVLRENLRAAAAKGFINATDCADYLVAEKGLPFRDAYQITGELVALCIRQGLTLESLPLSAYRARCAAFDEGIYPAISLEHGVASRKLLGGPAPENVRAQGAAMEKKLAAMDF